MPVMTRAQFAKMLQDGLNTVFGLEYDEWPEEYSRYMQVDTSDKAFEEDDMAVGFGYAQEKAEGGAYAEDAGYEAWTKRYTHRTTALSFQLTEEAIEDNRYLSLGKKYARMLARSLRQTKEVYCANVLNNAATAGYTGGDGVVLLSASHPTTHDGNQSNILTADLSEDALEQALIMIRTMKDDRGVPVMAKPVRLLTSPNDEFNAIRILGSDKRVDSANNDINAVKQKNFFGNMPTVVTNLTDTDAWFVTTDIPEGLKCIDRVKMVIPKATVDPSTGNIKYRARQRHSEGWSNWRGVVGSMGQ